MIWASSRATYFADLPIGMAGPDYILDVGGLKSREPASGVANSRNRPWLAIRWRCCEVYSRIYQNRATTAYEGRCPKCGRDLSVRIGAEGTTHRFFDSY